MNKAAFIDRDGTICQGQTGFINSVNDLLYAKPIHGAHDGMRALQAAGYELVIVTNQGGVARGFLTEAMLDAISQVHMDYLLLLERITILTTVSCPHDPDKGCECRKPKPGLLQQAATRFNLDLSKSVMIGDMDSDLEAGKAAGVRATYKVTEAGWPVAEIVADLQAEIRASMTPSEDQDSPADVDPAEPMPLGPGADSPEFAGGGGTFDGAGASGSFDSEPEAGHNSADADTPSAPEPPDEQGTLN